MVLIGTTTHFPAHTQEFQRGVDDSFIAKELRALHKHDDQQVTEPVDQFRAFGDDHTDMKFKQEDLGKIKARTFVVHGDRDMFFPVGIATDMYQGIPDSQLCRLLQLFPYTPFITQGFPKG